MQRFIYYCKLFISFIALRTLNFVCSRVWCEFFKLKFNVKLKKISTFQINKFNICLFKQDLYVPQRVLELRDSFQSRARDKDGYPSTWRGGPTRSWAQTGGQCWSHLDHANCTNNATRVSWRYCCLTAVHCSPLPPICPAHIFVNKGAGERGRVGFDPIRQLCTPSVPFTSGWTENYSGASFD